MMRFIFVFALGFAAFGMAQARAQSDTGSMQMLLDRVASGPAFSNRDSVTVGALPPAWTAPVPLPAGDPILGTVRDHAQRSVTIYYRPQDAFAAYHAYLTQLSADGFTPAPIWNSGGFQDFTNGRFQSTILCHGTQMVLVGAGAAGADDLRVNVPQPSILGGTCGPNGPRVAALPLPALVAPRGTVMNATAGSMSIGYSVSGPITSTSSSAILKGTARLPAIFASLVGQLRAAGLRIRTQAISKDAAIAGFDRAGGATPWNGSLAVYRGTEAHAVFARIDASGGVTAASATNPHETPLPRIPLRLNGANEPALLELTRVLATQNGLREADVFLESMPPGAALRAVPLPAAVPFASTVTQTANSGGAPTYTMYYRLADAQLRAYYGRLSAAGFTRPALPGVPIGGFQSGENFAPAPIFCRKDAMMTVGSFPSSNTVAVGVTRPSGNTVCARSSTFWAAPSFAQNSFPVLRAPRGVAMTFAHRGFPGATMTSAGFTGTLSLAELLNALTAQLTKAGWAAGAASVTPDVGSRSYTFVDAKGERRQAILTIDRDASQAGRYDAFINLVDPGN